MDDSFPGVKTSRAFEQCKFNREFLYKNMSKYDYLIFSGHWKNVINKNQLDSFDELLMKANELNIPIVIMASPYSFDYNVGNEYKRAVWLNYPFKLGANDANDLTTIKSNESIRLIAKKYSNTIFLSRDDLYSKNHVTSDGYPYSLDGSHISILGSKASASYFEETPKFQKLKNQFK